MAQPEGIPTYNLRVRPGTAQGPGRETGAWLALRAWLDQMSVGELARVAALGATVNLAGLADTRGLVLEDCDLRRVVLDPDCWWNTLGIHRRASAGLSTLVNSGASSISRDWEVVHVPAPNGRAHRELMYDVMFSRCARGSGGSVVARVVSAEHISRSGTISQGGQYTPQLLVAVCSDGNGRPSVLTRAVISPRRPDHRPMHEEAWSLWCQLAQLGERIVRVDPLLSADPGKLISQRVRVDRSGEVDDAYWWLETVGCD
jgi:hypothetical protein